MKNLVKVAFMACTLMGAASASAEVVVIVSQKHAAASMTAEEVANVYLGKDVSLSPVDLPEASSIREEFYKKVAGKDPAQVKAIWARLIFACKALPPKEVSNGSDAVKRIASTDKGIAYVDRTAVDSSVKVVFALN